MTRDRERKISVKQKRNLINISVSQYASLQKRHFSVKTGQLTLKETYFYVLKHFVFV